jgi:hypothetical protein
MALAGLRSGQVCLIVDGLSEMSGKFRKQLSDLSSNNQVKKLVITTRDIAEDVRRRLGQAWIVPPLDGAPLAQFVEDYISYLCKDARIITTEQLATNPAELAQFLRGYKPSASETMDTFLKRASAKIVAEHFASSWSSRSTCLFVTLRIRSLIQQLNDESLLGLCRFFFGDLIQHLTGERKPNLDQVVEDFGVLSLNVLRKYKFRISNFTLGEPFLDEDALKRLIDDVRVVETDSARRNASFTCDPIAEWLGAAQMLKLPQREFVKAKDELLNELSKLNPEGQNHNVRGFVIGLLDCQRRGFVNKENYVKIPSDILKALDIQAAEVDAQ